MKCYAQKYSNFDKQSYLNYLEEVFATSFRYLPDKNTDSFYYFESKGYNDVLLIRGETNKVASLLRKLVIMEKNVVIISCNVVNIVKSFHLYMPFRMPKRKQIYIPKYSEDGKNLTKYDGKEYDLSFDPCMAELKMLRDSGRIDGFHNLEKHFSKYKVKEVLKL